MIFLWPLLLLLLAPTVALACPNVSEGTKDVIVMYDTNFIFQEVEAARRGACAQGKKLVVLPYGYEKHRELGTLREEVYRNQEWYRGRCQTANKDEARCARYLEAVERANQQLKTSREGLPQISQAGVKKHFQGLAKQNNKVHSVILSGHDGSGNFSGFAGRLGKRSLVDAMKEAYAGKEGLLDDLNSVYLWGCYTATKSEVNEWNRLLPGLNIIGGFHGTGPSIGKLASHTVLEDLLSNEDDIVQSQSEREVESAVRQLENINYLLAGVYMRTCQDREYYYYRSRDPSNYSRTFSHFQRFGATECRSEEFVSANNEAYEQFRKYFDGEGPIPTDTNEGELRKIYNHARQYSNCLEFMEDKGKWLNPDKVALLLFFDGVKANFYNSFKGVIDEAMAAIDGLPSDDIELIGPNRSFYGWLFESGRQVAAELIEGEELENIKEFSRKYKDLIKRFPGRTKEDFMKMGRKELLEFNSVLHELADSSLMVYPGISANVEKIQRLKRALNIYVYSLNPECMDMLNWHEDASRPLYHQSFASEGCSIE